MADEKLVAVQIGNMIVGPVNPKQLAILKKREEVVQRWCEEHGKKIEELGLKEILEIRSLPEWKNPVT
ncbi:MAG: hypothetical protein Q7S53_02370 [bacterium]|nr:hypothetical protein [bacterium]